MLLNLVVHVHEADSAKEWWFDNVHTRNVSKRGKNQKSLLIICITAGKINLYELYLITFFWKIHKSVLFNTCFVHHNDMKNTKIFKLTENEVSRYITISGKMCKNKKFWGHCKGHLN